MWRLLGTLANVYARTLHFSRVHSLMVPRNITGCMQHTHNLLFMFMYMQHSTPKTVTFPRKIPRQLSWLGPNLTSHSTPDEQANHQLSMKEKAGVVL